MSDFFCYDWYELCSSNNFLDFFTIHYFSGQIGYLNMNTNEIWPHPLLCWNATSGAGGLWSRNQLIQGNAKQYSDMIFLSISR